MPKISVVMSAYNEEKYISEAIDSILNQTFQDFEFIIIDDFSTDNTAKIIKSYNDKRIKFLQNKKNLGLIKSLNLGLDTASGKYIARMDADDISIVNRFEKQIEFLDNNPDYILCGTWIDFFTSLKRKNDGHHKPEITYLDLLRGWCINHPTVMFKNTNLRYDENYPVAEDYEMWSKMIHYGKIHNIQENLLKYRWHDNNQSQLHADIQQNSVQKVKQKMLNFLTKDKKMQQSIINMLNGKNKKKFCLFGIPIVTVTEQ